MKVLVAMNSFAPQWDAANARHQRSAREALDRMLDRDAAQSRGRALRILDRAAEASPAVGGQMRRIADERAGLDRTAGVIAVAGASAAVAAVAVASLLPLPAGDLALRVLVAMLAIAMFRLVRDSGGPGLGLQLILQSFLTLLLLPQSPAVPLDLAFLALGWGAIAARRFVELRLRALDLDEMELALAAQGREDSIATMRRLRAAAI
jgi:hypothetical protein